jgi:hypothetical protein
MFFLLKGKFPTAKRVLPVFFALFIAAAALAFMGCKDESDDSGNLVATWKFGDYPSYVITADTIEYIGSYTAVIISHSDFEASAGSLIIQFTDYTKYEYGGAPDYELISSAPDPDMIGKYSGVFWKELTPSSVYLADAWQDGPTHVTTDTPEEAQTTFAAENYGDFGLWSPGVAPYTK